MNDEFRRRRSSKNRFNARDDYQTVEFPAVVTAWPNAIPPVAEWSGIESPVEQLKEFGSRYAIEAKFPPDYLEEHREALKNFWYMGSGNYDFDLIRPISPNNASRSCGICGKDASYYLFQDGVISTFRCNGHLPVEVDSVEVDNIAQ